APTLGRGLRAAPLKYPRQLVATLALLAGRRPRVVLVQSPPSFATWVVAAYAAATGAAFVVDAHSDAFERPIWTRPRFLVRLVARRAAATIVTNAHWARLVESWGGRALTVPSVPARFEPGPPPPLGPGFDVAVVNTWARDEPIEAVLAAAEELPEVTFHVTGRTEPVARLGRPVPPNVRFVGFLPEPTYYGLLAGARAVMCLTTRDHTMQNGACEALALGVPIVTSDWPVLRTYFDRGTVHVDNTPAGIVAGIRRLIDRYDELRAEIVALRDAREREWAATRAALVDMVLARLGGAGETRR
ncbi:MAG TPA: glycosyltransferase, partial [Candidatus Limnocylindrales bacterium]|nr:glycosyltransferase [Candidatus Limnocylindrales bacterium]